MYIYNIGYGTYEESHYKQYIHEKELSEKQLNDIVEKCITIVTAKIIKPKSEYKHERDPSFQTVMDFEKIKKNKKGEILSVTNLFNKELEKNGFKLLEFSGGWSCFGWASTIDSSDWKGNTGNEHKKTVRRIRRKIINLLPNFLEDLKIGKEREAKQYERLKKKIKLKEKLEEKKENQNG